MKQIIFLFLCALLSVTGYCVAQASLNPPEWDYFVYTQQWPQGACIDANNTGHNCSIPMNTTTWAVHGLWPDKNNTLGPNYCNKTDKFNLSLIEDYDNESLLYFSHPLMPKMKKYWPNFFRDTEFSSFWKHEWEKHGTCAATDEKVRGELKYFSMGLQLNRQYDLLSLLEMQGVAPHPTKPYNASVLASAANAALKHNVEIRCTYDHATKTHHLMEIEMCFDKSISPMQCPPHHGLQKSETCPKTKLIYYMPIQHSGGKAPIVPDSHPGVVPEAPEKEVNKVETNLVSGQEPVVEEFPEGIAEQKTTEKELGKPGKAEMKLVPDLVEEKIAVVWNGKEMVVEEDTKLVFKSHDEEKNQNVESFEDIWEKIVEEILEA